MTSGEDLLEVKAGYEAWAAHYDQVENATRDLDALVVRRLLGDSRAEDVLEIGCGTGKNTVFLVERFARVTALDFSGAMLEQARAKLGPDAARFIQHDILQPWPLETARFDLATCNLILEHIEDLRPVYREAARVLRPAGRFLLCEIHPYRQLRGAQAQYSEPSSDAGVPIRAYRHSVSEYATRGLEAGFRIAHVGEWCREGSEIPRLLSLLFERGAVSDSNAQSRSGASQTRLDQ